MLEKLINWLETHSVPCIYKKYSGVECPGCGMQRAFIALLKGNFIESLQLYPALIPVILLVVFLIIHLFFKLKNGARLVKILFFVNVFIIMTNYSFKVINFITTNYGKF